MATFKQMLKERIREEIAEHFNVEAYVEEALENYDLEPLIIEAIEDFQTSSTMDGIIENAVTDEIDFIEEIIEEEIMNFIECPF